MLAEETTDRLAFEAPVRAFGSLAEEVMETGVAGVVAMRYQVYVATAAQFVADLYAALAQGQTLGEAVTLGRKLLYDQPQRDLIHTPISLQDWIVPIVYEPVPIALFPRLSQAHLSPIHLHVDEPTPMRGMIAENLPPPPDLGFFGRDATLLALDRAFDTNNIALLHAPALSGKTATAAEFTRWYAALTGGVKGPALYTSLTQYDSLACVLDTFEHVFRRDIDQQGLTWADLGADTRRRIALQIMRKIPLIWIWDNVETVADVDSAWSTFEQQDLVTFLRNARETKAKFLLVSHNDEVSWLGDLPTRILLPPMPLQERFLIARTIAQRHGQRINNPREWLPLLEFSPVNIQTLITIVNHALRADLKTREHFESFVKQLQTEGYSLGMHTNSVTAPAL
jgi:hypothetical protein